MMTVRLRRWLRWRWLRWRWRWRFPSRWRNSTCCDILVPRPTGVSQSCKHLCQIKKGCRILNDCCDSCVIIKYIWLWVLPWYDCTKYTVRDHVTQFIRNSVQEKNLWYLVKMGHYEVFKTWERYSGLQKNMCRESTVPKIRCACENAEIFVICCHFLRFGRVLLFPNFQTDGHQNIVLLSLSEV